MTDERHNRDRTTCFGCVVRRRHRTVDVSAQYRKLCFATLLDGDGTELQAMLSLNKVGADALSEWKATVDIGDHVFVRGEVIGSRRGQLSVLANEWRMAAKALCHCLSRTRTSTTKPGFGSAMSI